MPHWYSANKMNTLLGDLDRACTRISSPKLLNGFRRHSALDSEV
jgi:hypothetical protein